MKLHLLQLSKGCLVILLETYFTCREQCVSSDLIREIETTSQEFKKNVHTLGREDRKRKLTKISESYQKAREYSDNKVQIAVQMYEMVNKGPFTLYELFMYCVHLFTCTFCMSHAVILAALFVMLMECLLI